MATAELVLGAFSTVWNIFIWTWWIILILLLFGLKKKWERHPMEAVIIEKRGDNLIKTNDRAGRNVDKYTNLSYYELMKSKDKILVYNFEWILHNADKPTNFLEKMVSFMRPTVGTIFLFRYGSKQYKPINIKANKDTKLSLKELKDEDGKTSYIYDYGQFDPRWVLGALDFEVVDWDNMNFMVQEQRATMERRQKKGEFWKSIAIPAMAFAVTALVAILILKYSAEVGASLRGGAGQPAPAEGSKLLGGIDNAVTPGS